MDEPVSAEYGTTRTVSRRTTTDDPQTIVAAHAAVLSIAARMARLDLPDADSLSDQQADWLKMKALDLKDAIDTLIGSERVPLTESDGDKWEREGEG